MIGRKEPVEEVGRLPYAARGQANATCAVTREHHNDRRLKELGIWVSLKLPFSLHQDKSSEKAFAILRMIRLTLSRITRMDF
ncbi:hypothetical protein T265_04892 [Opisthorchis viverrini]|uniref:Uncharacterized protein n=1 Tax=Opisthorchis viverrini TaxID=6198 RepID=A0A074ZMD1_OPIVI|nr:hypothetical protein T265_04892 [Opisthorchis viverrini]KER28216.1 hypothetical protein T265_04892 [Opisthorchis viverrini]